MTTTPWASDTEKQIDQPDVEEKIDLSSFPRVSSLISALGGGAQKYHLLANFRATYISKHIY